MAKYSVHYLLLRQDDRVGYVTPGGMKINSDDPDKYDDAISRFADASPDIVSVKKTVSHVDIVDDLEIWKTDASDIVVDAVSGEVRFYKDGNLVGRVNKSN